jgi:hypothetical protein
MMFPMFPKKMFPKPNLDEEGDSESGSCFLVEMCDGSEDLSGSDFEFLVGDLLGAVIPIDGVVVHDDIAGGVVVNDVRDPMLTHLHQTEILYHPNTLLPTLTLLQVQHPNQLTQQVTNQNTRHLVHVKYHLTLCKQLPGKQSLNTWLPWKQEKFKAHPAPQACRKVV